MNSFNNFGFGGYGNINPFMPPPNQQSSLQQYQNYMQQQPMQQQTQENPYSLSGRFVKSFKEVQSEPIPSDGSQVLFMLEDEPVFYIASYNGAGKKVISGYKFEEVEMVKEEKPTEPMDILASFGVAIDTIMNRLDTLESNLAQEDKPKKKTDSKSDSKKEDEK